MKYCKTTFMILCGLLLTTASSFSQEAGSRSSGTGPANESSTSPAQSGPGGALGKVLAAACSQNQLEFTHYLTVRNKDAFSRMTPAARVALMKRFVLLSEPGKASVSANPSGRPIVRCETPSATTEMQIGGAEVSENIAFLPLELREVTDTAGANVRQINMGLVREEGEWKLLSLGVLLLDLPALESEWDEAEIESTEKEALETLKTLTAAVDAYRKKFGRLPETIAKLGSPARGAPNAEAAGLLDSELVQGVKNGYTFRYVVAGASNLGAPAKYEISATPLRYGRTGRRSFFRDANGGLHAADRQGAVGSESDPRAE